MRDDEDLVEQIKQLGASQARQAALQARLAGMVETGTAGGGKVTVRIDGRGELLAVSIDPVLLEGRDAARTVGEIEALILSAAKLARRRIDQKIELETARP